MGQGVGDEIGQELSDARGVAGDGMVQRDVALDYTIRPAAP
jgi:hypothetical protein